MISYRGMTSVNEFAKKYDLGDPEYGNLYQAQYDEYSDALSAQLTNFNSILHFLWMYGKDYIFKIDDF